MKFLKSFILSMLICVFFSSYAHSADDFRVDGIAIGKDLKKENSVSVGQANFKASLTVSEKYDNNIYLTSTNTKADYINVVTPKVFMDLPFGIDERHNLQFLYSADLGSYSDQTSQNYQNQNLTGLLNFKLPFGYFALKNLYRNTQDRSATEFTTPVKRMENKSDALFGVEFNKLANEFDYSYFTKHFNNRSYDNLDYHENIYTDTAYYQVFPKTKALFEYNYGAIDYTRDDTRDGHYNQARIGLKGDITGKTTGIVKAGYQSREYDTQGRRGYNNFVSEIGLISKLSERTELTARFISTALESTFENNSYYNNNSFGLGLNQGLIGNYSLVGSFSVDRNIYPEESPTALKKRKDTIWTGGIGLEYQAKDWVKTGINYEYTRDNSNIDIKEYERSQIMASVTFMM